MFLKILKDLNLKWSFKNRSFKKLLVLDVHIFVILHSHKSSGSINDIRLPS